MCEERNEKAMTRCRTFSKREIQKILKTNGFEFVGSHGSRYKYKRGSEILMINPEPNKMIFNRLIKEYNLIV